MEEEEIVLAPISTPKEVAKSAQVEEAKLSPSEETIKPVAVEEAKLPPKEAAKTAVVEEAKLQPKESNETIENDKQSESVDSIVTRNLKTIKNHAVYSIVSYVSLMLGMLLALFVPFLSDTSTTNGETTTATLSFFNAIVNYIKMFIDGKGVDSLSITGSVFLFSCVLMIVANVIIGIIKIVKNASYLRDISDYAYDLYDKIVNKQNDKQQSFSYTGKDMPSFSNVSYNLAGILVYLVIMFVYSKIPYLSAGIPYDNYNVLIIIPLLVLIATLVFVIIDYVKFSSFKKEAIKSKYKAGK